MRCICVYCGILYNVKEPLENDQETHGNCDECDRMEKHNLAIYLAAGPGGPLARRAENGNAQDKNSRLHA